MTLIKERLLNEIDKLDESSLFYAYDLLIKLNQIRQKKNSNKKFHFLEIRKILDKTSKSLADDIVEMREERI